LYHVANVTGTDTSTARYSRMYEPLPILVENSIQIAWDYLERTGELGNPEIASQVLLDTIVIMIRHGERRKLLLSNRTSLRAGFVRRGARKGFAELADPRRL